MGQQQCILYKKGKGDGGSANCYGKFTKTNGCDNKLNKCKDAKGKIDKMKHCALYDYYKAPTDAATYGDVEYWNMGATIHCVDKCGKEITSNIGAKAVAWCLTGPGRLLPGAPALL